MKRTFLNLKLAGAVALFLASCGPVTVTVGQTTAFSSTGNTGAAVARASAETPRGYERLFSPHPHAFRMSRYREPVRRGMVSERFELRDGDCGGSDCINPRYRSEIRMLPDIAKAEVGRNTWYGWSFYNENIGSFTEEDTLRLVIGQWKMGGDSPAIFRFIQQGVGEGNWENCDPRLCHRTKDKKMDVVVQLDDLRETNDWGYDQNFGHICKLFSMSANKKKWVDIVVNTNFSNRANGFLRIWVNGELRCDYRGPLMSNKTARLGRAPSHRRGLFSAFTERWDAAHPGKKKPTLVAYYDEFLAGRSLEAVDVHTREITGVRPKD
jgi:hypothetical protein